MKAVIQLDVPDWQIGQNVSVYFPDTMMKHGKCDLLKEQEVEIDQLMGYVNGFSKDAVPVVRCKDCKHWNRRECGSYGTCESENMNICGFTDADWFCADGVAKDINVPDKEGR